MHYAQVVPASKKTVVNEAFVYNTKKALNRGQIVRIPLLKQSLNGVVVGSTTKPKFKTKAILKVLDLQVTDNQIKLAESIAKYYAAPLSAAYSLMIPIGAHKRRRQTQTKTEMDGTMQMQTLTKDQGLALEAIQAAPLDKTVLLHGKTGTGKTRVYLELAKSARKSGLGSIILIPEIGLTTQLVEEVRTVFSDVFVMHSRMSESERHLKWLEISKTKAPIVLGPRSALFSPIPKLGLVVIDESHEQSYKQDQTPKYNALRAARMLCDEAEARLVLGSATPLVDDYYLAKKKTNPIVRMTEIATGSKHEIQTELVDMSETGNRGQIITAALASSIERSLSNGLQAMIFHNRRGSSTSVICENCGQLEECPNCAIALTHHHDRQILMCHVCSYKKKALVHCDNCKQATLRYQGFGTKQIEQKLSSMFPVAKIARFDGDNTESDSLANRYKQLKSADFDIIVGTQMIAKGLDLPKLETVGIASADSLMFLPDFSSTERFFQLIYQVIGRVGRHRPGRVIVQTYNTTHPVLEAAVTRNFLAFYENEIAERHEHNYPPFAYLLSLVCIRKSEESAITAAQELSSQIKTAHKGLQVLGPAPAFYAKSSRGWRWQLVIKSKNRGELLKIIKDLPSNWQYDIDPLNLLG